MGEGDDGLQVFKQALVDLFGGECDFGTKWCDEALVFKPETLAFFGLASQRRRVL